MKKKSEKSKPRPQNGKGDELRKGSNRKNWDKGYVEIDKADWKKKWEDFKRNQGFEK